MRPASRRPREPPARSAARRSPRRPRPEARAAQPVAEPGARAGREPRRPSRRAPEPPRPPAEAAPAARRAPRRAAPRRDGRRDRAPRRRRPKADARSPPSRKRKRPPRPRKPNIPKDLPRTRAPLPLDELRDASRATLDLFGQKGIRDAFLILAPRERQDISALIANEEDHRPRTRNIANGSIGAGRIDKAMSATIISMARVEDLWAIMLDKESAAEKIGRIRAAKQRDKQKADRAKERANRSDRVSREDMAKARDGSVGATIRIVTDEKRERRPKGASRRPRSPSARASWTSSGTEARPRQRVCASRRRGNRQRS